MKKEIQFGNRILFVECKGKKTCGVYDFFLNTLREFKDELNEIMDDYGIPEQLMLRFKKGSGDLDAIYYVQEERVAKHMIIIDVYTKQLEFGRPEEKSKKLKQHLIETFIHELIHHKYESEKETDKKTKELAKKILRN